MADVKISELTPLTAAGISDNTDIRFVVDDLQSTPATKQLALDQLELAISLAAAISYVQIDVPDSGTPGLYSVQTGGDRGLYMWTGVEAVLLSAYSEDGTWPL